MSLSKNKIKYIRSLNEKKYRIQHGTFVAEGKKIVFDLLTSCQCELLAGLPETLREIPGLNGGELIEASSEELKKASQLKTGPQIIGIFRQPQYDCENVQWDKGLHLALDGIQDPGNMGTIVRLADWFGIEHIVCSPDTVDVYNPKTVQATMGALARVKIHYTHLPLLLKKNSRLPAFGTFPEGNSIYQTDLSENGFIVMGSEGNGISREVREQISRKLSIPNYPPGIPTSESLNVAVAAAIVCAEFRRRAGTILPKIPIEQV